MSISRGDVVRSLRKVLAEEAISTEVEQRSLFGADLAYEGEPPLAVVVPDSVDLLQKTVAVLAKLGIPFAPRGGGLSYSRGYIVDTKDWVAIDMRCLNRIIEINTQDNYVTVEAGCTWQQLADALHSSGLRPPFWGPYSGQDATVGAAVAQNAVFYGSGLFGTIAESLLGLSVVLPDGTLMHTGSAASQSAPSSFFRHLGPDLTGLFIGACGAFGIHATVTLALRRRPLFTATRGYRLASAAQVAQMMMQIGQAGVAAECMTFDPAMMSRAAKSAVLQEWQPGRRVAADQVFLLSTVHEGMTAAAAEAAAETVDGIARTVGAQPDGAGPLAAMRVKPFQSPTTLIGPNGLRWLPFHAIVPHSRHLDTITAIEDFMTAQAGPLAAEGLSWGFVSMLVGSSAVLIEPSFYWPDAPSAVTRAYLPDQAKAVRWPDRPELRTALLGLRDHLAGILTSRGAINIQIGRSYPFSQRINPANMRLLEAIKWALDPSGLTNPGVLDLAAPEATADAEGQDTK
ncbi:MAG: FAD-binding oxidoreductase [Rhodospirillaceae bacterium]|nr:FAD-binding oxidoreductase [Rhodospirillaceae bacterium]